VTYLQGGMMYYAGSSYSVTFEDEDALWSFTYGGGSYTDIISSSSLKNCFDDYFYDSSSGYSGYYYDFNYTKLTEQELPSDWFVYNGTLNVYTIAKPSASATLDCNIVTIPATYSKDGNPECPVSSIASGTFSGMTGLVGIKFEDNDEWVISAYANEVYVKGGMEVDATNSANNATMLTGTYASYTWYNYGSNLDSSWLAWDENTESYYVKKGNTIANYSDVIIPYKYNDGTHGEAEVTRIADSAFMGLTLGRVVLPFTLDKIGSYAFFDTTWDTMFQVYVPKRVAYIGCNAFNVESGTSYVPLLEKNTTWYYHPDLENWEKKLNGAQLSDPSNWVYTYIDMYGAGYYWYNDEATVLKDGWFYWNSGNNSYYISINGGWDENYTQFTVNQNIKGELVIPRTWDDGFHGKATVTSIDGYIGGPTYYGIFEGMGITKLTIHDGVTSIGTAAFARCNQLTQVILPSTLTQIAYDSYPYYTFEGCTNLAIVINQSSLNIVAGSTDHGYVAYYAIYVSNTVDTAMNMEDVEIDGVIYTAITWNDGRPSSEYKYIAKGLVDSNTTSITLVSGTTSIAPNAFKNTNLTSVDFSQCTRLTTIGQYAFSNTKITRADLGDCTSLTTIEGYAFSDCKRLTSVTIPINLTSIGYYAFSGCHVLAEIYDLSISLSFDLDNYGPDYLTYVAKVIHTSASIPSRIKTLNNIVYYVSNTDVMALCPAVSGLTSVTFDSTTTEINKYAFYEYGSSLTSVTIPEGVHTIGANAFYNYHNLSVSVPDSLRYVGEDAFYPSYLSSYNTYDNGRYLGDANNPYVLLFDTSSSSITSCTIHSSTRIIYEEAFRWCDNLTAITIPASVRQIGSHAFEMDYGNSTFKSVTFASGSELERIEEDAFYRTAITSFTVPASVTYIGPYIFSQGKISSVTFENTSGWKRGYSTSSLSDVDVTNTSTNANNLKSSSYIYVRDNTLGADFISWNSIYGVYEVHCGEYSIKDDYSGINYTGPKLYGHVIIPETFDDGVHGVGPVTMMADANAIPPTGVIGVFTHQSVTAVTIPSTMQYIGIYALGGYGNSVKAVYGMGTGTWTTGSHSASNKTPSEWATWFANGEFITGMAVYRRMGTYDTNLTSNWFNYVYDENGGYYEVVSGGTTLSSSTITIPSTYKKNNYLPEAPVRVLKTGLLEGRLDIDKINIPTSVTTIEPYALNTDSTGGASLQYIYYGDTAGSFTGYTWSRISSSNPAERDTYRFSDPGEMASYLTNYYSGYIWICSDKPWEVTSYTISRTSGNYEYDDGALYMSVHGITAQNVHIPRSIDVDGYYGYDYMSINCIAFTNCVFETLYIPSYIPMVSGNSGSMFTDCHIRYIQFENTSRTYSLTDGNGNYESFTPSSDSAANAYALTVTYNGWYFVG